MTERTKECPRCGGAMSFRLGEYQCNSCDYREPPAPSKPESTRRESVSRRTPWLPTIGSNLPSGRQYTGDLQPAKPSPREAAPPSAYGGMDERPAQQPPPPRGFAAPSWEAVPFTPTRVRTVVRSKTLQIEKHVCYGLCVLNVVLALAAIGFLMKLLSNPAFGPALQRALGEAGASAPGGVAAPLTGGDLQEVMGAAMVFCVVVGLVGVLLNWWAFYGTTIWAKWCCMSCLCLAILGSIASLVQVFTTTLLFSAGSVPVLGPVRRFPARQRRSGAGLPGLGNHHPLP